MGGGEGEKTGGPRGAHRVRGLDGWARGAVIATIAVFALGPLLVAARTLSDGWVPTGDVATIGLRALDAWTPDAPLVGQPTTGEERSGIASHHPGPIENWLLGPLVRLAGPAIGLLAGTALINGAALGCATWLAFRRGGPALLAITAAMLALLVHSLGGLALFDPFNSELPTYPLIATALAAWCVIARDVRVAPVFVVAGSIAAQPHVTAATIVAVLVAVTIVSLAVRYRRHPASFRADRRWLLIAVGAGFLCWLPPIIQELTGPSNVLALWRTQSAQGPVLGLPFVLERMVTAVAPIPLFARSSDVGSFLASRGTLAVLGAALVIGGAGSLALQQRLAHGRRGASTLYLVAVAVALAVLLSWPGAPVYSAFRADSFRWPWIVGFLFWLSLAWGAWFFLPADARRRARHVAPGASLAIAALAMTGMVATTDPADIRDAGFQAPTAELAEQLRDALLAGRYHLRLEGTDSVVTIGPGVVLELEADGWSFTVDDSLFGRPLGDSRIGRASTDEGELIATDQPPQLASGDRVVASATYDKDGTDRTVTVVHRP